MEMKLALDIVNARNVGVGYSLIGSEWLWALAKF